MARHTIQIPITKSSNDSYMLIGEPSQSVSVPTISDRLYLAQNCKMGVGWDNNQIPRNKKIISIKICLYANNSFSFGGGRFRLMDFGEGSKMPIPEPADGTFNYINSGWNKFNIPTSISISSAVFQVWYNSTTDYYEDVTFNSSRASSNKPYLEIIYDDIAPDKPASLYPSNITMSTRNIIKFSWLHNSKEDNQQKGFSLQYSINGGSSWTTVNQTTPNQFYDMPANTLPVSGTVMWRVRTTDGNDEISEYTSASFELGIVPQKPPVPLSPISQYLDENKSMKFEWSFIGGSGGETQSKFDLQYSINGGSSWTTITKTTSDPFYEVPANTFSGGNIAWRVRTYNNWNEVSPYSDNRSFTVIGSPPIPLINSISNSGRPTINWQSTDQHIYELQILKDNQVIFDTGAIPSTSDRSFRLPIYLKDGNYLVKLRIFNEYNLPSTWAEKSFTISTLKPTKPFIEVFNSEYSVTIKGDNLGQNSLIYRDDILIGRLENNIFVDFTGENKKEYKYFIRSIDNNDNFNDSEIKLGKCNFNGNTLATLNKPGEFIKLKHGLNAIAKKNTSISNMGTLNYYDGREYPVVDFTDFKSYAKTLTFFMGNDDRLKLIELINKKETLIYRDSEGENILGVIMGLEYEKNIFGYDVTFTITRCSI